MSRYLILLSVFLALAHAKPVEDSKDDAQKALEELKAIVQSEVSTTRDVFTKLNTDIVTKINNLNNAEEIAFVLEFNVIIYKLMGIGMLADSEGLNVYSCINETDIQALTGLLLQTYNGLGEEKLEKLTEVEDLVNEANIAVDLVASKVVEIEQALNNCTTDDCTKSIIEEIEQSKEEIPEEIQAQRNATESSVPKVLEQYQIDVDNIIWNSSSESNGIIDKIYTCVDELQP